MLVWSLISLKTEIKELKTVVLKSQKQLVLKNNCLYKHLFPKKSYVQVFMSFLADVSQNLEVNERRRFN